MASLKYLIFVALSVAVAAAADADSVETKANDIVLGVREDGDSLVYEESFVREAKTSQVIAIKSFEVSSEYTITQVRVLDQTNGNGGKATYTFGGPGTNRVIIGFLSKKNQEINYVVELYGKANE